jgi:hypothetical protein
MRQVGSSAVSPQRPGRAMKKEATNMACRVLYKDSAIVQENG